MNKGDLVAAIAAETQGTKKDAERHVDAFLSVVSEALGRGEAVSLIGFGTFHIKEQAARSGRHPRTGEALAIPAKKLPSFRAGKQLKEQVD